MAQEHGRQDRLPHPKHPVPARARHARRRCNHRGGTFDANDEEMLSTFTEKVADMLSARFSNLIDIADKFSG